MKPVVKRTAAWSLITAMAVSAAACGNSSDKSSSGNSPGASPSAATSASAAPSAKPSEGPKPQLRSLQISQSADYNTYPVAKVLEEKTGYKVQYDMLPADKPEDKLNLLIASGEAYDAITTLGSSDAKALYSDYAKRGALVDLGPLVDKYGPNIKAAISQASLDAAKVDGKLYAIPTKSLEFSGSGLMIRQDWLDKLGLKAPTTTDELTTVLKAFKEKDPGGNGDKNVPLTMKGEVPFIEGIAGAFGLANGWNDANGSLVPRALDAGYKEYVNYLSGLFKDGLLDKEAAINKDANMKEKFSSGKAGMAPINWADVPTLSDALKKAVPDAKVVYIPALKGPNGKYGYSATAGFDRLTFIPKASKHPEDAVKWLNAKLDPATFKLMAIGEENKHYTFKDGAYTPILPIFTDERNFANNFLMGVDEKNYPTYWQARVRKDPRLFEAWEYLNVKQPADTRKIDPLGLSPYLADYSKNNLSLNTLVNEQTVKFIVGADPLANYDAFAAKYKSSGGDASVKEVNDWYKTVKK
ncbi:extracellular solute-binding protein [Paenibacillus cymbidii]|uniref:extracellular solute-binding protein n=1 Tax=Paenibacillus cymbidii TaxID=1639034 RepID=UPI0010810361|nr:extracellular solute-binding protein [Paenibacillus cymbidii]